MGSVNAPSRPPRHPDAVVRLARYLLSWGLSHGPALAAMTYALLREAHAAGHNDPATQMKFAMERVDRWIDFISRDAPGDDLADRRLNVVARIKEALARHPQAFLSEEPPAEFLQFVHQRVPELVPPAMMSVLKPLPLGRVPRVFRAGFWLRLVRRAEVRRPPI